VARATRGLVPLVASYEDKSLLLDGHVDHHLFLGSALGDLGDSYRQLVPNQHQHTFNIFQSSARAKLKKLQRPKDTTNWIYTKVIKHMLQTRVQDFLKIVDSLQTLHDHLGNLK